MTISPVAQLLTRIEQRKGILDALRPFSPEPLRQLEQWYDVELTYTSNALEGNTLTRSETAIVIEKGITVRGKALKDHEEAVDHFEAMQLVRSLVKDSRPISEGDVCDIHRLVVAKTQAKEAGQYAKFGRRIAGSADKLAPPEAIPGLMSEFGGWLNQLPFTPNNAIEAHLRLVTIHPFSDGNGRTARLLMNLILMGGGYPPIIIQPEHRPDYIDSLEQAQLSGDSTDFVVLLLNRLDSSLGEYLNFFQGQGND